MKKMSVQMLVEAGILIALAQVLSYVKVYEAPYGGSVTAGSMVPVMLFAIRWGVGRGLFVGVIYGALQFLLGEKYLLNPLSILLDYIVAFGLLGLAGLYGKTFVKIILGTLTAVFARFISHLISGVVIWAKLYAEGQNPWLYSLAYNLGYLIPELIISILILSILYRYLKNANKL